MERKDLIAKDSQFFGQSLKSPVVETVFGPSTTEPTIIPQPKKDNLYILRGEAPWASEPE
jgi:hypothetical protein